MWRGDQIWVLVRGVLFRLDSERVHQWTVWLIRLGHRFGGRALRWVSSPSVSELDGDGSPGKAKQIDFQKGYEALGLQFKSRVGLAAGFDKNAEIVGALPDLGFGFAEIGTVTSLPQTGNLRPRLFRDPAQQSIFNRMGFNNLGALAVARNLSSARKSLAPGFQVGVNIGKGRDTPLEKAADDYGQAVRPFVDLADFIVVNVSSPNTQGLRLLQSPEYLEPIVNRVAEEIIRGSGRKIPILLKLAPELKVEQLRPIFEKAPGWGVSGWVLTNTLGGVRRGGLGQVNQSEAQMSGGWSGAILTELARHRLREARSMTELPIISVGGIMTEDEAKLRISLGANLVQIYSGWIYQGPQFPYRLGSQISQARS
jgi:dihydroorotate dehydrogenase